MDGQICFSEDLSAQLAEDQARLEAESESLVTRELELQAWSAELEQTREDLTALQATLETRWQDMQAFASEDLNHLAQMYGAMKPDQAATIFDQMDPGFAAGFLRLLNKRVQSNPTNVATSSTERRVIFTGFAAKSGSGQPSATLV